LSYGSGALLSTSILKVEAAKGLQVQGQATKSEEVRPRKGERRKENNTV
jgi:hypothetical protein